MVPNTFICHARQCGCVCVGGEGGGRIPAKDFTIKKWQLAPWSKHSFQSGK